jgi:hypothetical protein
VAVGTGADLFFDGPVGPEGFHLTDCIHNYFSNVLSEDACTISRWRQPAPVQERLDVLAAQQAEL